MSIPEAAKRQDLVFDVGMNNGEDSAYYLHLGHSVVGVDANPTLTGECALRFKREIDEGRMRIVNAGVHPKHALRWFEQLKRSIKKQTHRSGGTFMHDIRQCLSRFESGEVYPPVSQGKSGPSEAFEDADGKRDEQLGQTLGKRGETPIVLVGQAASCP
jgi:hypothetical protein